MSGFSTTLCTCTSCGVTFPLLGSCSSCHNFDHQANHPLCPANLMRRIDDLNIELAAWTEDPNGQRLEELEKKFAAANKQIAALEFEVATLKKDNQMLEFYVAEVDAQLEEALSL